MIQIVGEMDGPSKVGVRSGPWNWGIETQSTLTVPTSH
jgi:hypothetical protein